MSDYRAATAAEAERAAGRRLDRRRRYMLGPVDAEMAAPHGVYVVDRYVGACSGCACDCQDGMCSHGSGGCEECGYTGKRRGWWPCPLDLFEIATEDTP